jgi:hypothetical protein
LPLGEHQKYAASRASQAIENKGLAWRNEFLLPTAGNPLSWPGIDLAGLGWQPTALVIVEAGFLSQLFSGDPGPHLGGIQ